MRVLKLQIYSKCDAQLLLRPTQNSVRLRLRGARFHTDSQLNLQLIHPHHLNPCVNFALPVKALFTFAAQN